MSSPSPSSTSSPTDHWTIDDHIIPFYWDNRNNPLAFPFPNIEHAIRERRSNGRYARSVVTRRNVPNNHTFILHGADCPLHGQNTALDREVLDFSRRLALHRIATGADRNARRHRSHSLSPYELVPDDADLENIDVPNLDDATAPDAIVANEDDVAVPENLTTTNNSNNDAQVATIDNNNTPAVYGQCATNQTVATDTSTQTLEMSPACTAQRRSRNREHATAPRRKTVHLKLHFSDEALRQNYTITCTPEHSGPTVVININNTQEAPNNSAPQCENVLDDVDYADFDF